MVDIREIGVPRPRGSSGPPVGGRRYPSREVVVPVAPSVEGPRLSYARDIEPRLGIQLVPGEVPDYVGYVNTSPSFADRTAVHIRGVVVKMSSDMFPPNASPEEIRVLLQSYMGDQLTVYPEEQTKEDVVRGGSMPSKETVLIYDKGGRLKSGSVDAIMAKQQEAVAAVSAYLQAMAPRRRKSSLILIRF